MSFTRAHRHWLALAMAVVIFTGTQTGTAEVVVWKGEPTFHHSPSLEVFFRPGVPPLQSWTHLVSGASTDPVAGETKAVSRCNLCREWTVDSSPETLSRVQILSFGPHSSIHEMEINS